MIIKWKEKNKKKIFKPELILKELQKAISINEDNSVSFNPFEFQNNVISLYSMIDFPENSFITINKELLKEAVTNSAKAGSLNKDYLLEELTKLVEQENSKAEIIYYILTSISINYELPSEGINIGKTNIKFFSEYPPEFISRNKTLPYIKSEFELEHLGYTKVIIEVKAKSEIEAINKALDDLDLFRSLLSFYSNNLMVFDFGSNTFSPINKVRLGQIHTIHNSSGKIINPKQYWYEANFIKNSIHSINSENIEDFSKKINFLISNFNTCKYSNKLKPSLLRYVRAFDEINYHVSLLEIWGSLEYLTASNENNKDNIIKRCSFIFQDSEYHKQILEHLREYRNESIHNGIKHDDVKYYCYQVQYYFSELILFHLNRTDLFSSLSDVNTFLDHSTNLDELNKKKSLLEKIIKYRNGE